MPSFKTMKRINNCSSTIGQRLKEESDWMMEQTWMGQYGSLYMKV